MWFQKMIISKKEVLSKEIKEPLERLAAICAASWNDPDRLDELMAAEINKIPHCHLLYALDLEWKLINSNVFPDKIEKYWRGHDVSTRPYIKGNLPYRGFILSSVYISKISLTHCITAMQAVVLDGNLVGFIGADFNVDDITATEAGPVEEYTQYKGDPAIRKMVFEQTRTKSRMDENIDEIIYILDTLFCEHGVFHAIIHFSSSRVVLWLYEEPYNYRLNSVDELMDPEIWMAYPTRVYPPDAKVSRETLRKILDSFKALRSADDNIYLRQGSINIMNGMVGLTFSCDGSHYLQASEFIEKGLEFWI